MRRSRSAVVDLTNGAALHWLQSLVERADRSEASRFASVVVAADYLDPALHAINRDNLSTGEPWLLLRPGERVLVLGPLFRPGIDPCWRCLSWALQANAALLAHVVHPTVFALPLSRSEPAPRLLNEIEAAMTSSGSATAGGCLRFFTAEGAMLSCHEVLARPQCPDCGDQARVGRRIGTPDAVVHSHALDRLADPVTGILAAPQRLFVPAAPSFFVFSAPTGCTSKRVVDYGVKTGYLPRVFGKGFDENHARRTCVLEAVERWSVGCVEGDASQTEALARLPEDRVCHPEHLALYSMAQKLDRGRAEAQQMGDAWRLDPFDRERAIDWCEVRSLRDHVAKLAPAAFCYLNYYLPRGHRFCRSDSTGCAAGDSTADAIVRGFCELVERDAAAIWWYNRLPRPPLNLSGLDQSEARRLVAAHASTGRHLRVFDLTIDFPLPVFAAMSWCPDGSDVRLGLGCDFDPISATEKALMEVFLSLAVRSGGAYQFGLNLNGQEWLSAEVPARGMESFEDVGTGDTMEQLTRCVGLAEERDLELLYLDATRPEIGIPVVRTFAPGMRSLRPQFAPGRLYDVPVRLGLLAVPRRESELNPAPFPL